MVICLGWPSPAASSSLPAAHRCRCGRCGSHLAAYLALLRLGVTVPPLLPAARWALTPPFHPYPPALARLRAVCFLLPCPSPCGAQALPGSLPCGARTFLGCRSTRDHRARPTANITGRAQSQSSAPIPPPHPRQPCLRLAEEDLQVGIRRPPLAQHQLVLLGGLGGAAQLLVGRGPEQAHPPDLRPARIEATGEELVGVVQS